MSSNCGAGALFRTSGRADNWQDHVHGGVLVHHYYIGTQQLKHTNWGWRVGPQNATVTGPNLSSASAICIF